MSQGVPKPSPYLTSSQISSNSHQTSWTRSDAHSKTTTSPSTLPAASSYPSTNTSIASPHQILLIKHQNTDRAGFDSTDFDQNSSRRSTPSLILPKEPCYTQSFSHSRTESDNATAAPPHLTLRQYVYTVVHSRSVSIILVLVLTLDVFFFITTMIILLSDSITPALLAIYPIVDWTVATLYMIHVNLALYTYGVTFYFSSFFRAIDFVIVFLTFCLLLVKTIKSAEWLSVARFIRLGRILTCALIYTHRHIYQKTRHQLLRLSELLDEEKSEQTRLTRWKIDPQSIALGKPVGHGAFGSVYTALFRGTLVAIKQISYPIISPKSANSTSLEDEAITLVNLRHPNIILFMGFVHESSKLCIVTEYCSRGSLRDVLDNGSESLNHSRLLKLALGIARGLAYLHGQQPPVLHLDLKTSNVLISSGWDAKLADFGLSRSMDKIENDWYSGTMQYAAPEILESNIFSTAADIYSFGICLWEMAAREIPYQGMLPSSVLWGVVKNNLRPSTDALMVDLQNTQPCPAHQQVFRARNTDISYYEICRRQDSCVGLDFSPEHYDPDSNNCIISDLLHTRETRKRLFHDIEENKFNETVSGDGIIQNLTSVAEVAKNSSPIHPLDANIRTNGTSAPSMQKITEDALTGLQTDNLTREGVVLSDKGDRIMDGANRPETKPPHSCSPEHGKTPGKRKLRATNQPNVMRSAESSTALQNLSRKVTEAIQMFDDRPPIIRKRDHEESANDIDLIQTDRLNISAVPESPRGIHSRLRKNFSSRGARRSGSQSSRNKATDNNLTVTTNEASPRPLVVMDRHSSDTHPFQRRLTHFKKKTQMESNGNALDLNVINRSVERNGGLREKHCNKPKNDQHEDDTVSSHSSSSETKARKPLGVVVAEEYVDLIKKCWDQDPSQRPSAGDIVWRLVILIENQGKDV